jgi:hypothetical protein
MMLRGARPCAPLRFQFSFAVRVCFGLPEVFIGNFRQNFSVDPEKVFCAATDAEICKKTETNTDRAISAGIGPIARIPRKIFFRIIDFLAVAHPKNFSRTRDHPECMGLLG